MANVRCLNDAHGNGWAMYNGDCVSVIEQMPANSIDGTVISPPPPAIESMKPEQMQTSGRIR